MQGQDGQCQGGLMNRIDAIRHKIEQLYKTHPQIHLNVSYTHPKVLLKNEPVTIQAVYPHIFEVEETSHGFSNLKSIQYTDVLTKNIEVVEFAEL